MSRRTKLWAAACVLALAGPAFSQEPGADTVVATVNGTDITLGHMIALREALPAQYLSLDDKTLFDGILEQLIQQTALAQQVPEPLSRRNALSLDNQRLAFLSNEALNTIADAAVTDEALQALYDERYGAVDPGTEYHAAHILVATEDEAKAIRAELDGGADFATLAAEKSTGPSGPNGGDLGWFGLGMMVKPFEDAVLYASPARPAFRSGPDAVRLACDQAMETARPQRRPWKRRAMNLPANFSRRPSNWRLRR